MDGCVFVRFQHIFIDENSILVIVAFPSHEPDQSVTAKGQLAHFSGRTIGDDFAGFYTLSLDNQRLLIHTGSLVGAFEFQ